MTQICQMHPNLVGAPGFQPTTQVGKTVVPSQHLIMGDCLLGSYNVSVRLDAVGAHCHLFAVLKTASDGQVDDAFLLLDLSVDHRFIKAVHRVLLNLAAEPKVAFIILRTDQQTAGILVDAMNDSLTFDSIAACQFSTAVVQQRIDQCPLAVAGSGMDHHVLGLIHHQQMLVLIDNLQGNLLRLRLFGGSKQFSPVALVAVFLLCCQSGLRQADLHLHPCL